MQFILLKKEHAALVNIVVVLFIYKLYLCNSQTSHASVNPTRGPERAGDVDFLGFLSFRLCK